jgi:carbamoyltransferase
MNVKAHKVLHELPEVEALFVPGSGTDESLALGVCYQLMAEHCQRTGQPSDCIRSVNLYLGPHLSVAEVPCWIERHRLQEQYDIEFGMTPQAVARYLVDGLVIGRCAGRMEFGQRALGNRTILADPRRREMIEQINRKIKNRDFWMPFAPTVLAESASKYMINPKDIQAPFMTIAFDSTPVAKKELSAALHPADYTLRPQVLESRDNPEYHQIISAFQELTGVGGILNTSFNLHGEPIVCTPDDALHVFTHSEIDAILLENVLIKKRAD